MERRDQFGVTWISKKFKIESSGHAPMAHFYEDDDPRVRPVVDRWGRAWTIIGYTDTIPLSCPNSATNFGGEVIVYSPKGGVTKLHKETRNGKSGK